jgi:hypothetical protein
MSGTRQRPTRTKPGRRTLCTPERVEAIVAVVEAGGTDADACAEAGIAPATFYGWVDRGENGEAPYSEFLEALSRARARRPRAVLRRLADHPDWRAQVAYLHHLEARQLAAPRRRKAEAEVELLEARATLVRTVRTSQAAGGALLLPEDLLDAMPAELADGLRDFLAARGTSVLLRSDLAAGVTPEEVAAASPSVSANASADEPR